MPTSADLDRLEALVTRLTPLTETAPGELIRAQDWNLVVGALIEVARAAIGEGRVDGEVPPHEHPDQVAPGWLTPGLRDLLERGPLADPAAAGKLGDLERRLGRLTNVADGISGDITSMRASVAEVATRDLAREASVTQIRRVVEGVGDARDDVATLRGTLRSLEDSVKVAVDVSSRLTIDGQPVDMEAVGQRLKAVEAVRDRLTMSDGNLLDATAFETRLADLQGTLVTEQELDQALESRPGRFDPGQVDGLREELRAALGGDLDSRLQVARTELRAELDQRFAGVDDLVTSKIGEAVPGISEGVLAQARTELTTGLAAAHDEAQALVDDRLGKLDTELRAEINTRAQELREFVPETAKALLEDALPERLQPLLSRLDALDTRAGTLDERQQGLQTGLTSLSATVQDVARAQDDGFRAVRQELDAKLLEERRRVDSRFDDFDTRLPNRINDLVTAQLAPAVDERVKAAMEQQAGELEVRMRSVAADAAGEVEARIVERTDALVGERVETAAGELREQLNTQLATELDRMPRRVLTDASDDLVRMMDRRIDERVIR